MFEDYKEYEGENDPEIAEPETEVSEEDASKEDTVPEVNQEELNSKFAAVRREAEQKAERKLNSTLSKYGFNSIDELESHFSENEDKEFESRTGIKKSDLESVIKKAVENSDEIKEARAIIESQRKSSAETAFKNALSEISKLSGTEIKSIADLQKIDNFEEFDKLARSGVDMVAAFKATNYDKLVGLEKISAASKAKRDVYSKSHLTGTRTDGGGDEVIVPDDIKDMYRQFNPGITDKEIIEDYKKAKAKGRV